MTSERRCEGVRVAIRVRPGATRDHVGGSYGEGELMVSVRAKAADGRANEAARRVVADAFGVAPGAVTLLTGTRHRTKVVDVAGDRVRLAARLEELLVS